MSVAETVIKRRGVEGLVLHVYGGQGGGGGGGLQIC